MVGENRIVLRYMLMIEPDVKINIDINIWISHAGRIAASHFTVRTHVYAHVSRICVRKYL